MIYTRTEGEEIRNGFNFYPLRDWAYSRGFIFRLGSFKFKCRYSVKLKKWLVGND